MKLYKCSANEVQLLCEHYNEFRLNAVRMLYEFRVTAVLIKHKFIA